MSHDDSGLYSKIPQITFSYIFSCPSSAFLLFSDEPLKSFPSDGTLEYRINGGGENNRGARNGSI